MNSSCETRPCLRYSKCRQQVFATYAHLLFNVAEYDEIAVALLHFKVKRAHVAAAAREVNCCDLVETNIHGRLVQKEESLLERVQDSIGCRKQKVDKYKSAQFKNGQRTRFMRALKALRLSGAEKAALLGGNNLPIDDALEDFADELVRASGHGLVETILKALLQLLPAHRIFM